MMAYQNLSPKAFETGFQQDPKAVLLDVRTPAEVAEGSIAQAEFLDFFSKGFDQKVAQLDRTRAYYVYCRSGNRSGQACAMLDQLGVEAYNLDGGYMAWQSR